MLNLLIVEQGARFHPDKAYPGGHFMHPRHIQNLAGLASGRASCRCLDTEGERSAPFRGQPALRRMLSGHVSDLYVVRQYLEA